jgi:hypothetical protein
LSRGAVANDGRTLTVRVQLTFKKRGGRKPGLAEGVLRCLLTILTITATLSPDLGSGLALELLPGNAKPASKLPSGLDTHLSGDSRIVGGIRGEPRTLTVNALPPAARALLDFAETAEVRLRGGPRR